MTKKSHKKAILNSEHFTPLSLLSLYLSSYSPLLLILIIKIGYNATNLDNMNYIVVSICILIILLLIISIYGAFKTFSNIDKQNNGTIVKLLQYENKNSDILGYITTYIIPFMIDNSTENVINNIICLLIFIVVVYNIYVHSNLLLINPILSFKYSIFSSTYLCGDKEIRSYMVIKNKNIDFLISNGGNSDIKIKQLWHNLYYAKPIK